MSSSKRIELMEIDGVMREVEIKKPEVTDIGRLILESMDKELISVPVTDVLAPADLVKEMRSKNTEQKERMEDLKTNEDDLKKFIRRKMIEEIVKRDTTNDKVIDDEKLNNAVCEMYNSFENDLQEIYKLKNKIFYDYYLCEWIAKNY
jgi:hypothetical protein